MGFARGTLIKTARGHKKIEDIEVGDMVLTHKGRYRMVSSKEVSVKDDLREVSYIDGACWFSLVCSNEQKFYVFDRRSRDVCKSAVELEEKDMLVGYDEGVRIYYDLHYVIDAGMWQTYSLMVEEDESYTVTEHNVMVRCG